MVGRRLGWPVVLDVDARAMQRDGWESYRSGNGMWLVEYIPPCYLFAPPLRGVTVSGFSSSNTACGRRYRPRRRST